MGRTVFVYASILAISAFALTWLDYRFWMRDIGVEVYGLILAVVFIALGIWIERQRRPAPEPAEAGPNEKAIAALKLTRREVEILTHLSDGQSNKEIARKLNLSPNTVKTHLANLYEKLGAKNRTQAVTKARELSLF